VEAAVAGDEGHNIMTLRCFSYGGGVQSTAALVLAAQNKIDFPIFLFANVGDDSEHPAALRYVREIAMPYAASQGIALHELRHIRRDGEEETLYRKLTRPGSRSTGIPIYLAGAGAPGRRSCTSDFKIRRIAVWQRRHGATQETPAITGLGISLDEFQRARTDSGIDTQVLEYPLIDLRLTRQDCMNIIERADLPVPPKSSCWFCPFHRLTAWQRLKRETPDLFDKAVALERTLSDRSELLLGRGKVFLTRKLQPLDRVVGDQADMFEDEGICESGFCMT
jgi:hypothetical protein